MLLSFVFDVGTFFIRMFVSLFVLFAVQRLSSDLPLGACHWFSSAVDVPSACLARSVWNVVLANVQATLKNYVSIL